MKYILKNKIEPSSLIKHRKSLHANFDNFPKREKEDLRKALLEEQGYICAYCMNRIENDRSITKIEHFKPQTKFLELELVYKNLLAVCKGGEGKPKYLQHCDTKKGDELITINPLDKSCERLVKFTSGGFVFSNDPIIEKDLIEVLNLNIDILVDQRKVVIDIVKDKILSKRAKGTWTKKMLEKEIEKYKTKTDGKYEKYCQVIIFYLTKKLNRMRV